MAKKTKKEKVVVEETTQVVEQPKRKEPTYAKAEDGWEIKDRLYCLQGKHRPIHAIQKAQGIYWFDEEKGYERELKYCENQKTCFVDEMVGDHRVSHIVFRNGFLLVPKNKTVLQKLLSLYHPDKDIRFYEQNNAQEAVDEMEVLEMEIDALNTARDMDIDMAEAIVRVDVGSKVSEMSSKEIRRDLLIQAKRNPKLFLDLANDDNVHLRNVGIKALEMGLIKLSGDQKTFMWGSNDRKLFNVPFDEHPHSALAAWFKTDEGMEIYSTVEKRLNS